jgi:hypothetical protein
MRTRFEISRIQLGSLFRVAFLMYAALGLLVGIFLGLLTLLGVSLQSLFLQEEFPRLAWVGGAVGLALIPAFAVIYGTFGSVVVTIGGIIYNLVARFSGGLRFDTQVDVAETASDDGDADPTL